MPYPASYFGLTSPSRPDIEGGAPVSTDDGPNEIGNEAEFPDDAIDDDEVDSDDQLLIDRKELNELGLELDNPEGFADD